MNDSGGQVTRSGFEAAPAGHGQMAWMAGTGAASLASEGILTQPQGPSKALFVTVK